MNSRCRNALSGAKFGAKFGLAIATLIQAVCLIVIAFDPFLRAKALEQSGGVLGFVGGTIAGWALIAFYGAAAGAIIRFIFPP